LTFLVITYEVTSQPSPQASAFGYAGQPEAFARKLREVLDVD
jgi:hypothetical protein